MSNVPNTSMRAVERVYGCKYCDRKFSSKQAIGGHQNAHKLERLAKKRSKKGLEINFGPTGNFSNSGVTGPTFPDAYPSIIDGSYYSNPMQQVMYYSNSILPTAPHPYALQSYYGYPEWPGPTLTYPQLITTPPRMDNQNVGLWGLNTETTNSNAGFVLGMFENLSASIFAQSTSNLESNGEINDSENREGQDSGLDLSLRL